MKEYRSALNDSRAVPAVPSVCTVVLNYNNIEDTIATIKSVRSLQYSNNAILLVENSTEQSVLDAIRQQLPETEILESKKNLGYAGGNNAGIREALERRYEYILLLNNDVVLESDVLEKLVQMMEQETECAACQPLVTYFDDERMLWSAGTEMYFGYPRLYLKDAALRKKSNFQPPFGLVGCALLLRASAVRNVGMLDETLFLMHEETDWCIRAMKKGYSLGVAGDAMVQHKVSRTLGSLSKMYLYYAGRNWLLVGKKHFNWLNYGYILLTEVAVRIPYYTYHLVKKRQLPLLRFYLIGLADGLRGRSGERSF
jgi:GT2 family glycosyltransferase